MPEVSIKIVFEQLVQIFLVIEPAVEEIVVSLYNEMSINYR